MRALSRNQSEANTYAYLEKTINGKEVSDYYVSAEYYIYQDKIFKHKYNYSETTATYQSFVAEDYYFSISEYDKKHGNVAPADGIYTIDNIPDFNNDGKKDWDDFSSNSNWTKALPAGTKNALATDVIAPFNSVIDRNVGTATTEITITNASEPGTIEILKYTGELNKGKVLSGATFRVYEGDMTAVKQIIDEYNTAQLNLNNATPDTKESLQKAFEEASKKVDDIQVASSTTRVNGRVAFSGLDPETTYTVRERFAPSGYRIIEEYYQVNKKDYSGKDAKFGSDNYCLLNVGNSEASGNLEIRKQIQGRAWKPDDSFTFDIGFDRSGIEVSTSDLSLYSTEGKNSDELIAEFLKGFETTEDFTIDDKNNNYVEDSTDTKYYEGLLNSAIPSDGDTANTAKLKGMDFPIAGLYTFTIRENKLKNTDSSLAISPKMFTISINVVRTFNSGVEEGVKETLENTHLEASISKIIVQDIKGQNESGENEYGETSIYAGNTPTFVNNYVVETVEQKTNYIVRKDFTGRAWSGTDEFTFTLDGADEITKTALRTEELKIVADFDEKETEDEFATERTFTISKDTPNHEFKIKELDFTNVIFPVEEDEDGNHVTRPLEFAITIKEKIPEDADNYLYKGIKYSNNVYTLKMKLENAVDGNGETDGIIDRITLDLISQNDGTTATCVINQRKDEGGEVKVTETHASDESHIMTFKNTYKTNTITWQPIVQKTLIGRDWVSNDNFKFAVTPELTAEQKEGVTLPSSKDLYITIQPDNHSSRTDGSGFVGRLTTGIVFKSPGTYKFTIHEMYSNENGITVNTSEFPITVVVTDNQEGQLLAKYNDSEESPVIKFINTYSEKGQFTLELSKELKNRKWADSDNFKFTISPDEATKTAITNSTIKMPTSVGSLQSGKYTVSISKKDENFGTETAIKIKNLGDITFTKCSPDGDHYSFTIQEEKGELKQIECDNDKAMLDVVVSRETTEEGVPTGELKIIATQTFMSKSLNSKIINTNSVKEIVKPEKDTSKENTEQEKDTSKEEAEQGEKTQEETSAEKQPNGSKEEDTNTEEQKNENNENAEQKNEVVNEKAKTISAPIKNGTDTDETKENINNNSNENIQNSNASTNEPNLEETEESGNEAISLDAEEESTKSVTIQFVNTAYTEMDFNVEKVLLGRGWRPNEEFNIKVAITEQAEANSAKYIGTGSLDGISLTEENSSQNLQFKLYKVGKYTFNVNEIIPTKGLSGLAYDNNEYIVTITVADNGDGKLTPTMTINNKKGQAIEGENIKFTNTYTTGKLTVKNTILGTSSDRETKFTFTIKLSDQTINETFGEIKFVNGEATVELANGESAVMPNLPTGITYKVTQKDANKNGYGTTSEGTEGTITKENESIASFENTRYISLKLTGGTSGFWTIYKIVIIINIILGMIILRRFKYHKK